VPVIPGFNDSDDNIEATAKFLRRVGKREVNLLPFHRLAITKYEQLGLVYKYRNVEAPTAEKMEHLRRIFEANDVKCFVGSDTTF
jgi:pyruvate-formate lyase-activating enzyme